MGQSSLKNELTKDSMVECATHGLQRPAFICCHLQSSESAGFFESDEVDAELPFREAWCSACDAVSLEQGEWNDISEGHAQIMMICEGCLADVENRHSIRRCAT